MERYFELKLMQEEIFIAVVLLGLAVSALCYVFAIVWNKFKGKKNKK